MGGIVEQDRREDGSLNIIRKVALRVILELNRSSNQIFEDTHWIMINHSPYGSFTSVVQGVDELSGAICTKQTSSNPNLRYWVIPQEWSNKYLTCIVVRSYHNTVPQYWGSKEGLLFTL